MADGNSLIGSASETVGKILEKADSRGHKNTTVGSGAGAGIGAMLGSFAGSLGAVTLGAVGALIGNLIGSSIDDDE